jgi:hypothetical protein
MRKKLISHGFLQSHLHAAFRKFYSSYNDQVSPYIVPLGQMLSDVLHNNREAVRNTLILTAVCPVYLIWK